MASLQAHHTSLRLPLRLGSSLRQDRLVGFSRRFPASCSRKLRVSNGVFRGGRGGGGAYSIRCFSGASDAADTEQVEVREENKQRPAFDINLAVVLAGFAFEAYTTPPENVGRREVDAADCKTVYLYESFVREIYNGQLFVKLKKGLNLPALDPWGTSDPYVVMQLDGQVVKSKVKWGNKEPTWNEDFTFNIKLSPTKNLQVAAWDANIVTPHKRMGNASINLEFLCDGNMHEVLVELEGMGGGGKLLLEVKYKTFEEIDEEKRWWRLPFVSEFLQKNGFESAIKSIVGSETVPTRQYVEYAFGQLKSFNNAYLKKNQISNGDDPEVNHNSHQVGPDSPSQIRGPMDVSLNDSNYGGENNILSDNGTMVNGNVDELVTQAGETMQSDGHFWNNFADLINQNVVRKLNLPISFELEWDGFDFLSKTGLQSQKIAEAGYVESGLAAPGVQDANGAKATGPLSINAIQSSLPDIKKATQDLLKQTDSVLGAFMVLTAAISKLNNEEGKVGESSDTVKFTGSLNESVLDEKKAEEMRELFSTAESAMEAWAMLATSLGHPSFIKSEFEKICFLDNASTDTQVAIWRDSARRRLVVAFRGTEQEKWKDLRTDLMLVPAG